MDLALAEIEKVKSLGLEMGRTHEEFKSILVDVKAEEIKRGAISAELKERLAKVDKALTDIGELKAATERTIAAIKAAPQGEQKEAERKARNDAIREYMRKGVFAGECKTVTRLSEPDGGIFVRFERDSEYMRNEVETSPMRDIARVQPIGAAELQGTRRATRGSVGGWVGDTAARPVTTTTKSGIWKIPVYEVYANPDATQAMLDDSEANMEQWLSDETLPEFSFYENAAFTGGDGSQKPRGFTTYPSTDTGGDGLFVEGLNIITHNALAPEDLVKLQGKLKESYQPGASWTFTRGTMTLIRLLSLAGSTGKFLWQPGLTLGQPDLLLGKPYKLFADMAEVADATTPCIGYGDFKQGYRIIDRQGITVIRDPLTNKPFVQFYTTKRVGGDVVKHEAIKLLYNTAS